MTSHAWLAAASLLAALAVGLGAFGAHALPNYLGLDQAERGSEAEHLLLKRVERFETAARYHMYHALALLAVAWVAASLAAGPVQEQSPAAHLACQAAGGLFVIGIVVFSGCLYAFALTGQKWLGAIVPIGGVAFILGWLALAYAALAPRGS
jgi:uncharacterized membrane protein YgdD (TMEM256/DUF423 family)